MTDDDIFFVKGKNIYIKQQKIKKKDGTNSYIMSGIVCSTNNVALAEEIVKSLNITTKFSNPYILIKIVEILKAICEELEDGDETEAILIAKHVGRVALAQLKGEYRD